MTILQQKHEQNLADEEATLRFGNALAKATFVNQQEDQQIEQSKLVAGEGVSSVGGIVHLHGDLGAGKTTLTRGVLRGFGYQGAVKSPTYTIVEPYEFSRGNIYHFDLYRLVDPEEVEYLGVEDYFTEPNLCLIEWAEKGENIVPAADLDIEILGDGTGRLLRCQTNSEKGALIAKRLWSAGRNL